MQPGIVFGGGVYGVKPCCVSVSVALAVTASVAVPRVLDETNCVEDIWRSSFARVSDVDRVRLWEFVFFSEAIIQVCLSPSLGIWCKMLRSFANDSRN